MNKLIAIPLAIGIMCMIISMFGGVVQPDIDIQQPSYGKAIIDGEEVIVEIPNQEEKSFSMTDPAGIVAILLIAIAVGIVAGITVLGSGISEYSQSIIFVTTVYLAVWGLLSIGILDLTGQIPVVSNLLWIFLTLLYTLGVVQEVKT